MNITIYKNITDAILIANYIILIAAVRNVLMLKDTFNFAKIQE